MPHISPLRYPGGKAKLAPLLQAIIEANDLDGCSFAEPFAGGGGAALQLMISEVVDRIHLNDADKNIYCFWWAVLNRTAELMQNIMDAPCDLETWKHCSAILNSPKRTTSQVERAFAAFFLNRCNRSGIIFGGGPIGGYDQDSQWKIDARYNREELIKRIRKLHLYRDRIEASRLDAIAFLRQWSEREETGNGMLAFIDPPYYEKGQRLYLNSLDHEYHLALRDHLASEPGYRWVLTYDDVPEIRELYKDFSPVPLKVSYSAYRRRVGSEIVVVDPRLKSASSSILSCYN
jgi:DNA adenine methylase